jgi:ribonuclease D
VLPPQIIATAPALEALIARLRREPQVAVDTESNSLYVYYERVCLIQVSTRQEDFIIDPLALSNSSRPLEHSAAALAPLGALMADPAVEKVFHAAEYDLLGLKRDFNFEVENLFDTMLAARILGWPQFGLGPILETHFGVRLDKRWQRADWGSRPLLQEQLAYAQLDTHYLLPLRDMLYERMVAEGRLEEGREDFARIAAIAPALRRGATFDPEGYWRIAGAQGMSGREMAVLREVYLFREEQARTQNRPPFKVMGDRTLVKLAKAQPRHIEDLSADAGLSPYQLRRYGRGLLDAVARGSESPLPEPPRRHDRPDDAILARYDALREWRKRRAKERGVESDVILPREALWALARQAPISPADLAAIDTLGPWRRDTYGEEILAVLSQVRQR